MNDGQPDPTPTTGPHIADLVMADMAARKELGIQRYGVALQAGNGRDALQDAYEEALDLTMYLRQAIEERDSERQAKIDQSDFSTPVNITFTPGQASVDGRYAAGVRDGFQFGSRHR
jgi:hypothetical protein